MPLTPLGCLEEFHRTRVGCQEERAGARVYFPVELARMSQRVTAARARWPRYERVRNGSWAAPTRLLLGARLASVGA